MVKKCLTIFMVVVFIMIATGCDGKPSWVRDGGGANVNVYRQLWGTTTDGFRFRNGYELEYSTTIYFETPVAVVDGRSVRVYDSVMDTVYLVRIRQRTYDNNLTCYISDDLYFKY